MSEAAEKTVNPFERLERAERKGNMLEERVAELERQVAAVGKQLQEHRYNDHHGDTGDTPMPK